MTDPLVTFYVFFTIVFFVWLLYALNKKIGQWKILTAVLIGFLLYGAVVSFHLAGILPGHSPTSFKIR